jgi:hypothetical protein
MRENENRLLLVDPKPAELEELDALAEAPEEEEVDLEALDRTAERSLKRLVEPRMAPKLAAPEPMLELSAALAAPLTPAESAEDDEEKPPPEE